jgi:hypothetical protein
MSRSGVLAKGQVKAEASMVDACTIRRRLPDVTNTETGEVTKAYLSPDPYTGKCRVQSALARSQPHESGEDYVLLLRLELQLPVSVTGLRVDDEVTVTASAHDADLVGRVFLIRDLFHKTEPTARRVEITERTNS